MFLSQLFHLYVWIPLFLLPTNVDKYMVANFTLLNKYYVCVTLLFMKTEPQKDMIV